jgi:hypothetical protein
VVAAAAVLLLALGLAANLYGAVLIRVLTNKGQLVIETDDPNIEVVVKRGGQEIHIQDQKSRQGIDLEAGEWHLQLADGKEGLGLSTDHVTLTRGGRVIVSVRQGAAPAAREQEGAGSPDRPSPRDTTGLPLLLDGDYSDRKNVLRDDLWLGQTDDGRDYTWADGEYVIRRTRGRDAAGELPGKSLGDLANFIFEVEGRLGGSAPGWWGISWGHAEGSTVIDYEVREAGHGGEVRVRGLLPWTRCPALRPITERNTLRAEVLGTRMRLFVNGQYVAGLNEEGLRPGRIELYTFAEQPPIEARFRRVRVWRLPDPPATDRGRSD